MSTLLIAEVNLKKPTEYQKYLKKVPDIVTKYGGEYLVRGGNIPHHEGYWKPKRLVVIKFPDRQKTLGLY